MAMPILTPARPDDRADGALGPYVRAILAHRALVAVAALVALAAAVGWTQWREPTYEATAEVLVTPLPSSDGDAFQGLPFLREFGEATRTIQTAATLIDNPAAAELAARRLGPGWDRVRVQQAVRVEAQGESQVLAIHGQGATPADARRLADTYTGAALEVRRRSLQRQVNAALVRLAAQGRRLAARGRTEAAAELAQRIGALEGVRDGTDPTLSFSERAALPTAPLGAPAWLVAVLALVAGFAVGTAAALARELTDRRVRDEDEVLGRLAAPVLARTPVLPRAARRPGALLADGLPPVVREAFRTLRAQLERQGTGHRTIMFTSAASGDGKTTSAISLALSLVAGGHRVLLVDFDLRRPDVARTLGLDLDRGLAATLGGAPLDELAASVPGVPGLRVVAAATRDGDVALLESLRRRLPAVLEEARTLADVVVVDTAPLGEVADALAIADQIDDVVVVTRPGHTPRANLDALRDLLAAGGLHPTGLLVVGQSARAVQTAYPYADSGAERGPLRAALARGR